MVDSLTKPVLILKAALKLFFGRINYLSETVVPMAHYRLSPGGMAIW
jgi:hypothetical protein